MYSSKVGYKKVFLIVEVPGLLFPLILIWNSVSILSDMFTCNFTVLFYEKEKRQDRRSEDFCHCCQHIWNASVKYKPSYCHTDHTFSVRQYGAAVPLHDSNLNHSYTVRLWGLRNSNKPSAMEMQHTTYHSICVLADNIKKTALLIKYYLTFSQHCIRKSTEKDKISCKKYISNEQTALGYHPSQTSVPTIHATASWWMKLKKISYSYQKALKFPTKKFLNSS